MSQPVAVVVEDKPHVLALLTSILESEGFSVVSIADSRQMLEGDPLPEPSIMLVDIGMPWISGVTLAQRLRSGDYPTTPMIALSATPALLRKAHMSGCFSAVLQKPFELVDVLDLVERHAAS